MLILDTEHTFNYNISILLKDGFGMKTKEIILCKFGEVVLKGANRQNFESALVKELRRRASPYGNFNIYFNCLLVLGMY